MDLAVTKLSSKGQVVIPKEMRKNLKAGDKLLIIKNKDQLILKKTEDAQLEEDLEFAKRTEEAYQRYLKGDFVKMSREEFLEELKQW